MNNKMEIERVELLETIWCITNDLRGCSDGWGVKSNMLRMLFYRFVSANLACCFNEQGSVSVITHHAIDNERYHRQEGDPNLRRAGYGGLGKVEQLLPIV